jgi:diaminobutyrate-2-oxoglutarate transaminase
VVLERQRRRGILDARIHFCGPAGTDAVEAVLKLTQTATGRRGSVIPIGSGSAVLSGVSGGFWPQWNDGGSTPAPAGQRIDRQLREA